MDYGRKSVTRKTETISFQYAVYNYYYYREAVAHGYRVLFPRALRFHENRDDREAELSKATLRVGLSNHLRRNERLDSARGGW